MLGDVYPTPDDTAIVMYTSGSTGTPKVFSANKNFEYFEFCLIISQLLSIAQLIFTSIRE